MRHHGADAAPGQRFASAEALALYRLNALDAQVKGAFEQGALRAVTRLTRPSVKRPFRAADRVNDGR